MRKTRMFMVVCGLLMLGAGSMFVSQSATAQEGAAQAPPPMTSEQMKQMGAMMDMMSKPAEEHKVLAGMEGNWDVTTEISFPGMGSMTSHSTTTAKWILGGAIPAGGHDQQAG